MDIVHPFLQQNQIPCRGHTHTRARAHTIEKKPPLFIKSFLCKTARTAEPRAMCQTEGALKENPLVSKHRWQYFVSFCIKYVPSYQICVNILNQVNTKT